MLSKSVLIQLNKEELTNIHASTKKAEKDLGNLEIVDKTYCIFTQFML